MSTATETLHPHIADALKELDDARANVLALNHDAIRVAGIFAQHSEITANGYVQSSTNCIAYRVFPETMEQLAGLLRDLRTAFPEHELSIKKAPENGLIHYYLGPVYLVAALNRKCTFKKVGVETVEKPVYELVCE